MINVIIPTYFPGSYLIQCLQSLNNQTLDPKYFRVLIILNGKKEPYYSWIMSCIEEFKCKIDLYHTDTRGVSNARNIGIDNSIGKYITFIDDDDYISPNYLKNLLECMGSNSEDTIVCSDVKSFDTNGTLYSDYISKAYNRAFNNGLKKGMIHNRKFLSSSCCKLIPLSIIGSSRFHRDIDIGEDALFMATLSCNIHNVIMAPSSTIYYRRLRSDSASRRKVDLRTRLLRKSKLIRQYIKLYVLNIPKYNLLFICSRILATIKL